MRRKEFLKDALFGTIMIAGIPIVGCKQGNSVYTSDEHQPRTVTNIDFDWLFHLGGQKGAEAISFDDQSWRSLDLPHDWSIEGEFDLDNPTGWRGGYMPAGIGWYRKHFNWDSQWEGKKVSIRFDGVYMNSEVWINGHYLGKRPYGYITFDYDLTPYLKKGENTLAVRVDNKRVPSGRWYTGSGIYRHVWLTVTDPVHVAKDGTFITTPRVEESKAKAKIEVELQNETNQAVAVTLKTDIFGPNEQLVNSITSAETLPAGKSVLYQQTTIQSPTLWSTQTPRLYKAVHSIKGEDGQLLDQYSTPFGIRDIQVNAEKGFLLNGQKIKLKGVCNHHDAGPVGAAVPEDVLLRRLKLLKEMGCNAIRTAHNPAAPELYDFCDQLGFLVVDEAFDGWDKPKAKYDYGLYFDEWWKKDLTSFIKRDRNHPSVVIWSIGNEVPGFTEEKQKELVDHVKSLDTTRPVTQGRGHKVKHIDIAGLNGHGENKGALEKYHRENPDKPVMGTEITHTLQTRGVYQTTTSYRRRDFPAPWEIGKPWSSMEDEVFKIPDLTEEEVFPNIHKAYQSSYDNAIVRIGVRDQYKRTQKFDWLIGTFRWTGFDYLGEATISPARTANFGILDLAGFPKDHYYLYQSLWTDEPMVHLLPHWTHPGKEGVQIPIVVYSNCETVELLFNEESLGEKPMTDELQIVWKIPYQPGTLHAVARNGKDVVAEKIVSTAQKPHLVDLKPDKSRMRANRTDVVHIEVTIEDKQGTSVPEASNLVEFNVQGPGTIIGVENGDILDFDSMKGSKRKAFNGKCLVMVQSTDQPGEITVEGKAGDLIPGKVSIKSA